MSLVAHGHFGNSGVMLQPRELGDRDSWEGLHRQRCTLSFLLNCEIWVYCKKTRLERNAGGAIFFKC